MFFGNKKKNEAEENSTAHKLKKSLTAKDEKEIIMRIGKNKEVSIDDAKQLLETIESREVRILLLKYVGNAYALGEHGVSIDPQKALEYYKIGAELGCAECMYLQGITCVFLYGDKDKLLFFNGVVKLCESYKKGYEKSGEALQNIIDKGIFPNCKTVDDMVAAICKE